MPITRPVANSLTRAIVSPTGVGFHLFSPATLWAAGEAGFLHVYQDINTLTQDSAGSTPVTAFGNPIGRALDRSGRGNHGTQSTGSARPLYQQSPNGKAYALFDGLTQFLQTAAINFTGTDKVTVFAAVRKISDAAAGSLVELGTDSSTVNGTFQMRAPAGAAANYSFNSRGTATAFAVSAPNYAAPNIAVLTGIGNIAGDIATIRVNGTAVSVATDQGTGNYANLAMYIGRRSGTAQPCNAGVYALGVLGRAATAGEIASMEAFMASLT